MYISSSRAGGHPESPAPPVSAKSPAASDTASDTASPAGRRARGTWWRAGVDANVLALGSVSMVTDISSEMITAVLPMYVIFTLGLSPLQFGALNGMYFGVTALVRVAGGHAADRWQRRKLVAGSGYALSAACKLGLLAAGASVPVLGAVIAADRTGKGLRTGPRDALISLSSTPETLGRSFGAHRALDTTGAFLGPLAAFGLLLATPGHYDTVFVASFCVAALAVMILVLFVRDRRQPMEQGERATVRAVLALLLRPGFRRVGVGVLLLGTVTLSDSFVYLLIQQRLDISEEYFPLLPLGTTGAYLLLAMPLGRFADKAGRLRVFVAGYAALLCAYLLLFGPVGGPLLVVLTLVLHGVFYAATDGVLMAAVGPMVPAHLRAAGMSLIQTGQSMATLASSVLFGAAWSMWGLHTALAVALAVLVVAVAAALIILPLREEHTA
ncbi:MULTISPECIES: MFS transporter [unclassified Streptomyces]|uniref:MFS transporter n=1 Tax=unclassified Streptomyces TaxID=2593676 RepID=UPI002E2B6B51|nr:MFS transporter [Streptomyces sp. NBC_00223]